MVVTQLWHVKMIGYYSNSNLSLCIMFWKYLHTSETLVFTNCKYLRSSQNTMHTRLWCGSVFVWTIAWRHAKMPYSSIQNFATYN